MAGNLVPRTDGGANLGTASKEWDKVYAKELGGTLADIVAPLANPDFTGVPTAPTAASGTSTTQLATTKFVVDEIADNLAGSIVPGTDGTASLGSASKEYNKIYAKELGGTLAGLVAMNDTSQRGTAYSLGDTVRMPGIPVEMYLECTTAGTTDATAPAITPPVAAGDTITDGTCEWSVRQCETTVFKDNFLSVGLNHNGMYRGKNLGTWSSLAEVEAFLTAHKVSTGEFDDLYLGDYVTIQDGTYNKAWEIAAFDQYLNKYAFTTHHIVLMPKSNLTTSYMNSSNTTSGGYAGSYMHTTVIPTVITNLTTVLGNHLLTRKATLSTSVGTSLASMSGAGVLGASNDSAWSDVKACLASEVEIYGSMVCSSSFYDVGEACEKLPIFNFKGHSYTPEHFWLRAVTSSTSFCFASDSGASFPNTADSVFGVRPLICVG